MADKNQAILIQLQFEADQAEKKAKRMERQVQSLERRFDPLARATQRYEREMRNLERAFEAGVIDQQRYKANLASLDAEYQRATQRIDAMATATTRANTVQRGFGGVMSRNRSVFQQVGYQVGDFAVQVQGGTSAITAFSQQGSQLLGVFGAYGAIMGAALAVGAPLLSSFLELGEATEDLEDRMKALNEVMDEYRATSSAAGSSYADLRERFGRQADQARELLRIEREMAALRARDAFGAAASNVASNFGNFGFNASPDDIRNTTAALEGLQQELFEIQDTLTGPGALTPEATGGLIIRQQDIEDAMVGLSRLDDAIRGIERTFDVPRAAAEEMAVQLVAIQNAATFEEQATAAAQLAKQIYNATDGLVEADEETQALHQSLTKAAMRGLEIQGLDIAGTIGAGADEAARLAVNMQAAARSLIQAQSIGGPERAVAESQESTFVPGKSGTLSGVVSQMRVGPSRSGRGGRGGGGGGREERPLFDSLEQETDALRRRIEMIGMEKGEIAALQAKYKLLEEAKKRGLDLDQQHAETGQTLRDVIDQKADALGRLTEEYERGAATQQELEGYIDQFADDVGNLAGDFDNLGDVFRNMLKRMASDLVSSGIRGLLNTTLSPVLGGGGGFGGGGLGGPIGGILNFNPFKGISFDGGGYTGNGARSGGMDGKGGFPAMLHPQETVIDHTKGQSMGRSEVLVRLGVPKGVTVEETVQIAGRVAVEVTQDNNKAQAERGRRGVQR